jgi:hypothetical protein
VGLGVGVAWCVGSACLCAYHCIGNTASEFVEGYVSAFLGCGSEFVVDFFDTFALAVYSLGSNNQSAVTFDVWMPTVTNLHVLIHSVWNRLGCLFLKALLLNVCMCRK